MIGERGLSFETVKNPMDDDWLGGKRIITVSGFGVVVKEKASVSNHGQYRLNHVLTHRIS